VTPIPAPVLMRASGVIKPLSIAFGSPGAYAPGEPNAVYRRCTRFGAALPALCGVSPLPNSSGKTNRNRLKRGGNRQANATLHQVVVVRLRWCRQTKDYAGWRMEKDRSESKIMQCLKRFIAREAFHTVLIMLKLYSFVI